MSRGYWTASRTRQANAEADEPEDEDEQDEEPELEPIMDFRGNVVGFRRVGEA